MFGPVYPQGLLNISTTCICSRHLICNNPSIDGLLSSIATISPKNNIN